MTDNQVDALQAEVLKLRRRRVFAWLPLGLVSVLWAVRAYAATYDCTLVGNTLPFGLNCFAQNAPAIANEVNYNFSVVGNGLTTANSRLTALESRATALETRATNVENRAGNLSLFVNGDGGSGVGVGLANLPHVQSGNTGGACGQSIGAPCNVALSGFTSTPNCVAMAFTPNLTGYNENPVLVSVTPTNLALWKGQYPGSGVTLIFQWICVGN